MRHAENSESLNLQRSISYMFEQQQRNIISSEDEDDDKMEFHGLIVLLILNDAILMYLLHAQVLKPLDDDRIRMAALDPSEIIATPIKIQVIEEFTVYSVLVTIFCSFVSTIFTRYSSTGTKYKIFLLLVHNLLWNGIICGLVFGSAVAFFFAILAGASPVVNVRHTLCSMIYVSCTTVCRAFMSCTTLVRSDEVISKVLFGDSKSSFWRHLKATTYGTFFGVMLCMILVTYDWGAQIQRWPVPILVGSTTGNSIGLFCSMTNEYIIRRFAVIKTKKD